MKIIHRYGKRKILLLLLSPRSYFPQIDWNGTPGTRSFLSIPDTSPFPSFTTARWDLPFSRALVPPLPPPAYRDESNTARIERSTIEDFVSNGGEWSGERSGGSSAQDLRCFQSTMRSRAFLQIRICAQPGTILTRGNDLPGFPAAPEGKFNNRESGVEKDRGGDNCFGNIGIDRERNGEWSFFRNRFIIGVSIMTWVLSRSFRSNPSFDRTKLFELVYRVRSERLDKWKIPTNPYKKRRK